MIDKVKVMKNFKQSKKKNMYISQKERDVIRSQMEYQLHKFECEVDKYLRNNQLQLAKINHNVVDVIEGILNKIKIADYEDVGNDNYC